MAKRDWNDIKRRVEGLDSARGGVCPECGRPDDGGGPPLIVIRNAVTGALHSAHRGGEEISEEELGQIEEQACSLCDKGPQINIGGPQNPTRGGLA
jgi:hypothetical protein